MSKVEFTLIDGKEHYRYLTELGKYSVNQPVPSTSCVWSEWIEKPEVKEEKIPLKQRLETVYREATSSLSRLVQVNKWDLVASEAKDAIVGKQKASIITRILGRAYDNAVSQEQRDLNAAKEILRALRGDC